MSNKLHTEEPYSRTEVGVRAIEAPHQSTQSTKKIYISTASAICMEYYPTITADTKEKRNFIEKRQSIEIMLRTG